MVVVADVNSDGKPDLIVLNCGSRHGSLSVTDIGSVGVTLGQRRRNLSATGPLSGWNE